MLVCHKRQQVHTDAATQMVSSLCLILNHITTTSNLQNKTGCFVNSRQDKVLHISGCYETADEYHARLLSHVITLQTYWRQWLAKRYVAGLRRDKILREQWEREEAVRRKRERDERAQQEFDRRMNPRTREDFDLLYHALESE